MDKYCARHGLGKLVPGTWAPTRQIAFWKAVEAGYHPGTPQSARQFPQDFYVAGIRTQENVAQE